MATDHRDHDGPRVRDTGTHPLAPERPDVPEHAQPRSLQSHPEHVTGQVDDFTHDGTVAHEESDVNVRAIITFTVALFVIGAIVHVALWALMGLYERRTAEQDRSVTPLAAPAGTPPPEPRLLTDEPAALQQLRTEEEALLKEIGRAKDSVVGKLPARAGGKPPERSPSGAASRLDTSSGRQR